MHTILSDSYTHLRRQEGHKQEEEEPEDQCPVWYPVTTHQQQQQQPRERRPVARSRVIREFPRTSARRPAPLLRLSIASTMQSLLPLAALVAWRLTLTAAAPLSASAAATAMATRVGNTTDDGDLRAQITSKVHAPEDFARDDDSEERMQVPKPLEEVAKSMEIVKAGGLSPSVVERAAEFATKPQWKRYLARYRTTEPGGYISAQPQKHQKIITREYLATDDGTVLVTKGLDDSWMKSKGAQADYKRSAETVKKMEEAKLARQEHAKIYDAARRKDGLSKPKTKESQGNDGKPLVSLVGRDNQVYTQKGERVVTSSVVMDEGGQNVLLISGSDPLKKKGEWLLPRGGLEKGESVRASAKRELYEEGGVSVDMLNYLGPSSVIIKGQKKGAPYTNKYHMHVFKAKANKVHDKWPEDLRQRIWVPVDDAINILMKDRPHMAEFVYKASQLNKPDFAHRPLKLNAADHVKAV